MNRKTKTEYPGGIEKTTQLKYLQKNNYFKFIKQYQELLIEKQKGN